MEYIERYINRDVINITWITNIIFLIMTFLFYIIEDDYNLIIKAIPITLLILFIIDYLFSGKCLIYKILLLKLSCVFWLFVSIHLYLSVSVNNYIYSLLLSLLYISCFLCSYKLEHKINSKKNE